MLRDMANTPEIDAAVAHANVVLANRPKEFVEFDKIPRLFRECAITEKIDGTNAAIVVMESGEVYAQSRNHIITPGKSTDNYGFAGYVAQWADMFREYLGEGRHFGEWWGVGIGRNYAMRERCFSLFNTKRWTGLLPMQLIDTGVRTVPILREGIFSSDEVYNAMDTLREFGSQAAPGFMQPEGVVIYHKAGRCMFKATLENDSEWKGKRA